MWNHISQAPVCGGGKVESFTFIFHLTCGLFMSSAVDSLEAIHTF